ncbi:hypothetical protein HQ520_01030, partial [bacterium]|nr:hypothetical protein [bacterium]
MLQSTYSRFRVLPLALALLLVVLGLSGCAKQRANYSLNKAKSRLQEAREVHNAPQYSPEQLETAQSAINQAQQAFDQQNFEAALDTAKRASELSKDLLDLTVQRRAQALKEQATKHVQVAIDNQGETIDSVLYNQITENDRKAAEALAKQKYEKTIELALQVKTDTDTLLQALKRDVEEQLNQAKSLLDQLLREQGRTEAPQYVTDTETKIAEMEQQISYEQRRYLDAKQTFREIQTLVENGITEARKSRSKKKIANLEQKLLRARFEEAEKYHGDFLASVDNQFAAITRNFFNENYFHVLDAADLLEPQIDRLILETCILAAKDRMNQMANAIASLDADKVREFLPGRLEKMEQMLEEAQKEFKVDLFDEVKRIAQQAMEEKELILKDFNNLAVREIRDASGEQAAAEQLLEGMGNIFGMQAPLSEDPQRMNFENSKQALRAELAEIVRDSSIVLAVADVQRQDEQYSIAIESARRVVNNSKYVIHQIYHTLAHNNVMTIAERASRVAGNGGAQFAPDEMQLAREKLQKAQEMINQEEAKGQPSREDISYDPDAYKPAVAQTAEAFAELETVIQRVKFEVTKKIELAGQAINRAEADQANVYALGDLATARQTLQNARDLLGNEQLHASAQQADASRQIALQASVRATRAWADEELNAATQALQLATDANAPTYSPERYRDARGRLLTSREIYQNARSMSGPRESADAFLESKTLAVESTQPATAARIAPITAANQAILTAQQYNA